MHHTKMFPKIRRLTSGPHDQTHQTQRHGLGHHEKEENTVMGEQWGGSRKPEYQNAARSPFFPETARETTFLWICSSVGFLESDPTLGVPIKIKTRRLAETERGSMGHRHPPVTHQS